MDKLGKAMSFGVMQRSVPAARPPAETPDAPVQTASPAPKRMFPRARLAFFLFFLLLLVGWVLLGRGTADPTSAARNDAPTGAEWQVETLETYGDTGQEANVAVDDLGRVHVAALRQWGQTYEIRYLLWDGVTWRGEVVATRDAYRFPVTVMRLDLAGAPHIFMYSDVGIEHFFLSGTTWHTELVPMPNNPDDLYAFDVVPGEGTFHVFALHYPNRLMSHYARQSDGTWLKLSEDLFGPLDSGDIAGVAAAMDTTNKVHLMYSREGTLRHAVQSGPGWTETDLGVEGKTPYQLAVDSQNRPHMAFRQGSGYPMYAFLDGNTWAVEPVGFGSYTVINLSLILDNADVPHLAFWKNGIFPAVDALTHAQRVSEGNWAEDGTEEAEAGGALALALLDANTPVIAYQDFTYFDLKMAWRTPAWVETTAQPPAANASPMLALNGDVPALGFHAPSAAAFAWWNGQTWAVSAQEPLPAQVSTVPVAYDAERVPHLAFYQPERRTLVHTFAVNGEWVAEDVISLPLAQTVGPEIFLLLPDHGNVVHLVYTVTENDALYLAHARRGTDGNWTFDLLWQIINEEVNLPLAAGLLGNGEVAVAYAVNGNIYMYTILNGTWSHALILGEVQPTHIAMAVETRMGFADGTNTLVSNDRMSLAFDDPATNEIYYASEFGRLWTKWSAGDAANIEDLALVHRTGQLTTPSIAYLGADNSVHLLSAENNLGIWTAEIVSPPTTAARSSLSLAFSMRERLAWLEAGTGGSQIVHAFRRETREVGAAVSETTQVAPLYKGGCLCLFYGLNSCSEYVMFQTLETPALARFAPSNGDVFAQLTALFQATPEGNTFAFLYAEHDHELWTILTADPVLLWDAYRTLDNLMPGLDALVSGQGSEVMIDTFMMSDAADIWQRIASEASPALADEINARLLATDNLQDYAGMTFDEWALSLGVEPGLGNVVYLPLVIR